MGRFRRAKDIVESAVNEAQTRDASPFLNNLVQAVPQAQQAIASALGEVSTVASAAKQALDAISAAAMTAQSIGVEQNAIIDNLSAVQQADPSQSVITLTDHRPGVEQSVRILSNIMGALQSAMSGCNALNRLAATQFL